MSFSRQRELISTGAKILKQKRILRRKYKQQRQNKSPAPQQSQRQTSDLKHDADLSLLPDDIPVSPYEKFDEDQKEQTIFVSVASYRDPECPLTVEDLFMRAKFPGRVIVGVCQQNANTDIDVMTTKTNDRFSRNIRVIRLPHTEARGPMYARALIEEHLFNDEDYYMVIDSHTKCIQDWDVHCIKQLAMCKSPKPILTCYPEEFDRTKRKLDLKPGVGSFLRFRNFHPRIGFSQQDRIRFRHQPPHPLPTIFWAAGFSFSLGSLIHEVPFDKTCEYLFLGEEISMAARFFTRGWDTFAPTHDLVFHYTPRTYRHTYWENFYNRPNAIKVPHSVRMKRKQKETETKQRLQALLTGQPTEPVIYGLGADRTLEQFEEFTGLNFKTKEHTQRARLGLTPNADEIELYYKWNK